MTRGSRKDARIPSGLRRLASKRGRGQRCSSDVGAQGMIQMGGHTEEWCVYKMAVIEWRGTMIIAGRLSRAADPSSVHGCRRSPRGRSIRRRKEFWERGRLTVYIGTSGCGWNASLAVQSWMVCSPTGLVRRKIPNLRSGRRVHERIGWIGAQMGSVYVLWLGGWSADDSKGLGKHALEARVSVKVDRRHKA